VAPANPSDLATVDRVKGWASLASAGLLSLRTRDDRGAPTASGVEVMLVTQALGEALVPLPYAGTIAAADLLSRAGAPADWLDELGAGDARYGLLLSPDLTGLADLGQAGSAVGFDVDGAAHALALTGPTDAPTPVRVGLATGVEEAEAADLTRRTVRAADVSALAAQPVGGPLTPADRDRWLSLALVVIAADLVGTMTGALRKAVDYAKEREQYGVKIGTFQAVQHLCADALVQIEAAASTTRYASWALDASDPADALFAARVAKACASSVAAEVTETVMQVFGGIGQTWEHIAHVHTRRALTDRVLLGDESHHLLHIADARLGPASSTQ
jgi:alkylation response protein AidB-like acyl-CoA dehydrogenase